MTTATKARVSDVIRIVALVVLGFCIAGLPLWRLAIAAASIGAILYIDNWRVNQAFDDLYASLGEIERRAL